MAITFKYGAPGPILQAGFAAGVGRRQHRQQDNALEVWQRQSQQQFQAEQAAIGRQFEFGLQQQQFGQQFALQDKRLQDQALQDQRQRDFQAEQAGLGRNFQIEQNKALIEARTAESGRDREHDLAMLAQRNDYAIQEGLRSGELELPPEAQNRLRQLESGRVEAMRLDPVQQKEFMDQYEQEKRDLLGLAQPAKQPSIGEQFDQSTIERNGTLYQRGKGGDFNVLREPPEDTSRADMEKYAKNLQAEAIRIAKEAGDTEGDLSPYIDQAKKNLAGVGFADPQQQSQSPVMRTVRGTWQAGEAVPDEQAVGSEAEGKPANGAQIDLTSIPIEQLSYLAKQGSPAASGEIQRRMTELNQRDKAVVQANASAPQPASQQTIAAATRMGFKLVKTPEEAAALPAGTRFITPEGRTGTTRGKPKKNLEQNPTDEEFAAYGGR